MPSQAIGNVIGRTSHLLAGHREWLNNLPQRDAPASKSPLLYPPGSNIASYHTSSHPQKTIPTSSHSPRMFRLRRIRKCFRFKYRLRVCLCSIPNLHLFRLIHGICNNCFSPSTVFYTKCRSPKCIYSTHFSVVGSCFSKFICDCGFKQCKFNTIFRCQCDISRSSQRTECNNQRSEQCECSRTEC